MSKAGTDLLAGDECNAGPEAASMTATWIGVDVSKRTIVAARRSGGGFMSKEFTNDAKGFADFLVWLPSEAAVRVVMEATGPYWRALACCLESQPEPVPYSVVNPRKVRRFAEASPERSKDDWIDAEVLTHFAETFQPPEQAPKSNVYHQLRATWRYQLTLVGVRDQQMDQREKYLADPKTPASLLAQIGDLVDELDARLRNLLKDCLELLKQDSAVRQTYCLLLSIPGIGPKTALTLITEYGPSLTVTPSRQLTSYAGFDPVRFESGTSVKRPLHISKQGNWRLRRALYIAALTAIRHNPRIKDFFQRKKTAGLSGRAALVAAARKLLELVAGVLANNKPFEKNYAGA